MGAGTDARIVAKLPVIEVVHATPIGFGAGENFVLVVASGRETLFTSFLHGPRVAIVRQRRWVGAEYSIRSQRQLVMRNEDGLERDGAANVVQYSVR